MSSKSYYHDALLNLKTMKQDQLKLYADNLFQKLRFGNIRKPYEDLKEYNNTADDPKLVSVGFGFFSNPRDSIIREHQRGAVKNEIGSGVSKLILMSSNIKALLQGSL